MRNKTVTTRPIRKCMSLDITYVQFLLSSYVHLFLHVSIKRAECYFVWLVIKTILFYIDKWFFWAVLQTCRLNALLVTAFHKTYVILKETKWHHYWRSWDILITKADIPTIFYHFSRAFIWYYYITDTSSSFCMWINYFMKSFFFILG